jgi:hypothetical protein
VHELSSFPNCKYDDQGGLYLSSARLDQAGIAIVECLELQLARLGFGEASRRHAVAAIADEFRLPIELVRRWIDEEHQKPPQQRLGPLEMLKRAHLDFCAWCDKELGYDVPISRWGARNYHPECLAKMLSH